MNKQEDSEDLILLLFTKIFQSQDEYLSDRKYIKSIVKRVDEEFMDRFYYEVLVYIKEDEEEPQHEEEQDEIESIASIKCYLEWIDVPNSDSYLSFISEYKENLKCPILWCDIDTLYVDKNYRGKRYGTILLEHLERCCIEISKLLGANDLFITLTDLSKYSQTTDSIYIKQGFEYKSSDSKKELKKKLTFKK